MRVATLNLTAFGRFSDTELVFLQTVSDFHLVYGANEAGKTTIVQAFRSLLYGIEARTPYAFAHPYTGLRVGAQLTVRGKTHEIVRRKGNKNTLQDGAGQPLEDAFLQQLLAAMEREQFERMFALTHEDLVAGGQEIVAGQGEVGQALFAAGLGGVSLSSLLRRTQERLEDLFKPRSKAKPLNQKLAQVRDLDLEIRNLQLSGEQWAKRRQEAAEAHSRLSELTEQGKALAQEQLRLKRLQRTLPLLHKWAGLKSELGGMADVVSLPPDFDERHRHAVQQAEDAERRLFLSRTRLGKAKAAVPDSETLDVWLSRAKEIKRLHERLGSYTKGQEDSVKLRADHQAHLAGLAELLTELPGKPDLAAALQALPDVGVRAAVEALAPRKQALNEALRTAQKELEECQAELAEAAEQLAKLPPERDVSGLKKTIAALQKQGDLESLLLKCEKAVAKETSAAQQQLERLTLWRGVVEQVLELQTPLYETVGVFADRFRELEAEAQRLGDRKAQLEGERTECQQRLQQLELAGAVPLEADLTAAREDRDAGWQLIKSRYLLDEEVDLAAYAPEGEVAGRYEGQVATSDEVADRLRREAQQVHERADLETRLQRLLNDLDQVRETLRQSSEKRDLLGEEWRGQWSEVGIEPLTPEEMREWLRRLEDLKVAVERLSDRQEERDAARAAVAQARETLAVELTNLGEPPASPEDSLTRLMGQAESLLEQAQNTGNDRAELARKLDEGGRNKLRREKEVVRAEADLGQWGEQWAEATQALDLGAQPTVERVTAVLRVFAELDAENKEASSLDRRLKGIERDAADFQCEVTRLVTEVAPEWADLALADAARELHESVGKAHNTRTLVDRLNLEIDGHEADIATDEEVLGEAGRELQALAKLAQGEVEGLALAWERSQQRLKVEGAIRETEEQLSIAGDSRSLADLQAEAYGCNPDQVEVQLDALDEELAQADEQREQQRKLSWDLDRAASESDDNAAAAAKADERQALIAGIRDEVEQYLTLAVARQLLVQAMESYRAANQDPLLQRASDLFARMTGHSFSGLSLQYRDADHPVLVGVRAHGGPGVTVEGMSDGTCDQLYLALRLAASEQFTQRSEPLPLLVDDILIRFDDDRARETLAVLGEVAQSHQVIFFTHHRRLMQLADEVLGAGKYGLVELSV